MAVAKGRDIVLLGPSLQHRPAEPHLSQLAQSIKDGRFVLIGRHENVTPRIHVPHVNEAMKLSGDSVLASVCSRSIAAGPATAIEPVGGSASAVPSAELKLPRSRGFEHVARTEANTGTVAA